MINRRSEQPKLIYFAERKPKMDRPEFQARWRQHARLGMSMPRWKNIHRYVHCDAIEVPALKLPIAWCDGVAVVWYRDEKSRLNHVSDKSAGPVLKQDEEETFARPVCNFAILTDEYVIKPSTRTVCKLFVRIWRRSEIRLANFKSWWLLDVGPRLVERLEGEGICQGYSQNHVRPPINGGEETSICDCVDEFSSGDAKALDTAMAEAFQNEPKLNEYVEAIKVNWTHESVLYEAQ